MCHNDEATVCGAASAPTGAAAVDPVSTAMGDATTTAVNPPDAAPDSAITWLPAAGETSASCEARATTVVAVASSADATGGLGVERITESAPLKKRNLVTEKTLLG